MVKDKINIKAKNHKLSTASKTATKAKATTKTHSPRIYPNIKQLQPKVLNGSFYGRYVKRGIDILVTIPLLIITAPVAAFIAIAIKLEDGGPVFFVQERSGLYGKIFKLIKFRSMSVENDVHDFSKENSETKVGSFIRKTSLDELPQLINILRGDMALIGPRPWIEDYSHYFTRDQCRRLEVRPGLSGLAQIKSRNLLSIQHKIWWDIYYVDHLSFKTDLKVFLGTFKTLFDKEGAKQPKSGIRDEIEELKRQHQAEQSKA